MTSPDSKVTGDTSELLERIRDEVFSLPLLPQKDALVLFRLLDISLQTSVELLIDRCNFVERYLADVVAEVAASVTHGRTIYESGQQKGDAGPNAVFKKRADVKFLERAIDIIRVVGSEGFADEARHKSHVKGVLRSIRFARLVYEDVVSRFSELTTGYVGLSAESADLHRAFHVDNDALGVAGRYPIVHDQMDAIELAVRSGRSGLYHVCLEISRQQRRQRRIKVAIYEPYLRIVYKEARKHATNTQQVLENFQNGSQGLLRAVSCYNASKKVSFSSYAHWWIRQAILFQIKESSNFVKLPVTTWQTFTSVEKKRAKLTSETGDDDLQVLADETGHSVEKLKDVYDSVRSSHVHSLDYEVDDTGKMMLMDVIPDPSYDEKQYQSQIEQDVRSKLNTLPEDERFVLMLHYGLFDMLADKQPIGSREILAERNRQMLDVSL